MKLRKWFISSLWSMAFLGALSACGTENPSPELSTQAVETSEEMSQEEDTSKEKGVFDQAVKVMDMDELSELTDAFHADLVQAIHLDDAILSVDEFTLTKQDDYDGVLAELREGRQYDENIAGDTSIYFSDFILKYTPSYLNGARVGVAVEIEPRGDECTGFYIECSDMDWYVGDDFLLYRDYPDYSDILELLYSKVDVDESKLSGGGIVGIWYQPYKDRNMVYIFYNDNTGIYFYERTVNSYFIYEIIDDETLYIDHSPDNGQDGRTEKYQLDGDQWIENLYEDTWVTYVRIG